MFRSNVSERERGWDIKAEVEAHGLMLKIADPQFIDSKSVEAMCLIPSNLFELNQAVVSELKARYGPDMPNIFSFT